MKHEDYMSIALGLAREALSEGEVPVGCVITDPDGKVVGQGRNRRETDGNALGHAELIAIREACSAIGDWRLNGFSMYVTLEPCPMCAGAVINSRLTKIFYGAKDPKAGACGSVLNLFEENFNHKPQITGGVLEPECSDVLSGFFTSLRKN